MEKSSNITYKLHTKIRCYVLQVCLNDLQKLPLMYPALKLMFAEHYEEMELRALKRQLQKERETARSSL